MQMFQMHIAQPGVRITLLGLVPVAMGLTANVVLEQYGVVLWMPTAPGLGSDTQDSSHP
jgi:hypothetical protein